MALFDKNILITPNKSANTGTDPVIQFIGADAATSSTINLRAYPTNNGTLSFEGSAGQLFSVVNTFTGIIFAVNDISGLSSISVTDTGTVTLAGPGNGFVSIASTVSSVSSTTGALIVAGGVGVRGDIYAQNVYSNGSLLTSGGGGGGGGGTAIQAVTNTNYFLTFVDSNNATAQTEVFYTTSSFVVNPFSKFVGFNTATNIRAGFRYNFFSDTGASGAIFGSAGGGQTLEILDLSGATPQTSVNEQAIRFSHLGSFASTAEGTVLSRIFYRDNSANNRFSINTLKDSGTPSEIRVTFDYLGTTQYSFSHSRFNVASTANSFSTSTGALTVAGGGGFGQNLAVGGDLTVRGIMTVGTSTNTVFNSTGDLILFAAGQTTIVSTASSVSTSSGAFVVNGGVGIGGDLFVGGAVTGSYEPVYLDSIQHLFDGDLGSFTLRRNQVELNTSTIVDARDFTVIIDGNRIEPFIDPAPFAFLPTYGAYKGFRVRENRIIIYDIPEPGSKCSIIYQKQTTGKQVRRYPIPPYVIGLGD